MRCQCSACILLDCIQVLQGLKYFEERFLLENYTHKIDHINFLRHVFRNITPVPAWMMFRHRAVFILFSKNRLDVCDLFPSIVIFFVDVFKVEDEIIFEVARAALPVNSKINRITAKALLSLTFSNVCCLQIRLDSPPLSLQKLRKSMNIFHPSHTGLRKL